MRDNILLKGTVEVKEGDGPYRLLGDNLVLSTFRRALATWSAGQSVQQQDNIPHTLSIGLGPTIPLLTDVSLERPYLESSGNDPLQIPLVGPPTVEDDGGVISAVYEFELPAGMVVYNPSTGFEETSFQINEFGLSTSAGVLLCRKTKSYSKDADITSMLRWTIFF